MADGTAAQYKIIDVCGVFARVDADGDHCAEEQDKQQDFGKHGRFISFFDLTR